MHLQPMYSFEYHFSQSKLGSEWDIINKIRNTFKKFGRDYKQDFPHTVTENTNNRLHEAPKYLKPLNKNDSIITWWKYPVNFVFKNNLT